MGLRLYVDSADSDATNRSQAKGPGTAHSRSSIRRTRIDRERSNLERRRIELEDIRRRWYGNQAQVPDEAVRQLREEVVALERTRRRHGIFYEETRRWDEDFSARRRAELLAREGMHRMPSSASRGGEHSPAPHRDVDTDSRAMLSSARFLYHITENALGSSSPAELRQTSQATGSVDPHMSLAQYEIQHSRRHSSAGPARYRPISTSSYYDNRPRAWGGMGDRDLSPSPDTDHETWHTLFSTIAPDPQAPSTRSSFASTTTPSAVPSLSNGGAASSNASSLSSAESPELPDAESPCEPETESESTGSEGEATLQRSGSAPAPAPAPNHPLAPSIAQHSFPPSVPPSVPPMSALARTMNGPAARALEHGAGRYLPAPTPPGRWASRLEEDSDDQRTPLARNNPPRLHQDDDEWSGMHSIIGRLAHRDDIPEEWWADAGLGGTLNSNAANTGSGPR